MFDERAGEDRFRRGTALAFLHQWPSREISPPMEHPHWENLDLRSTNQILRKMGALAGGAHGFTRVEVVSLLGEKAAPSASRLL
jgi:hypothetical protein